jgi:hypothetical protein
MCSFCWRKTTQESIDKVQEELRKEPHESHKSTLLAHLEHLQQQLKEEQRRASFKRTIIHPITGQSVVVDLIPQTKGADYKGLSQVDVSEALLAQRKAVVGSITETTTNWNTENQDQFYMMEFIKALATNDIPLETPTIFNRTEVFAFQRMVELKRVLNKVVMELRTLSQSDIIQFTDELSKFLDNIKRDVK